VRISISFVFVACASCAGQPLIAALITMAPCNVVSFLAGSVRLLQKRVDMLESMRPFDPEAPEFTPKTLLRLESLVPPPGIFDLQPADVHLAALVNELMKDDNVSASDAIEPKLLDGAIQRAEAVLRASDAIEPKLLDDEPEISFEYWKFSEETCVDFIQRSKNLSNNFIPRSKNLSVEVSDVPSPDNFSQFIDDNEEFHPNNFIQFSDEDEYLYDEDDLGSMYDEDEWLERHGWV